MGLWQGIFIVLGCAVAGLLLGLLLIYVFQRIKKKRLLSPQKEADFIKTETPKTPVPIELNNRVIKSNGQDEDALEILVKNHKDNTIAENQRQSLMPDDPKLPEIINQKNTPIVEKQEKPSQTNAIHWTELFKQGNTLPVEEHKEFYEPLTPQEPATINQKNTLVVEEHKEPSVPSISKGPEITNQKTAQVEERQKKPPKSSAQKRTVIINDKSTSIVREQKKSPKPSAPQGLEIINQKSTPIVEKKKESPKSDFIKELETNLTIATTTWSDKLIPFQTSCWDAKHGEGEPLLTSHHQDLMQLYVDIGLANNIVWLATEIGHRSKDLDESYIKLCDGIAESLKRVVPSLDGTI